MESQLNELRALASLAQNRRTETGIPRVAMVQGSIPEHELAAVYDPMVNLILRGSKSLTVGGRTVRYDPATYFVMSVDLPAAGVVQPSAFGEPYLAVSLTLEPSVLVGLLSDLPNIRMPTGRDAGFSVASVTAELLDAWLRMMRLMRHRADITALGPAYEREILYRVLQGPMGWMLRDIALPDTALARVHAAIKRICRDYVHPLLRTAELAHGAAGSMRGSLAVPLQEIQRKSYRQ